MNYILLGNLSIKQKIWINDINSGQELKLEQEYFRERKIIMTSEAQEGTEEACVGWWEGRWTSDPRTHDGTAECGWMFALVRKWE